MNKFTCIKPACSNEYETNDAEAYYCPSCVELNKAIAKKVDAQIASRPKKKSTSSWQEYENSTKARAGGLQGVIVKI